MSKQDKKAILDRYAKLYPKKAEFIRVFEMSGSEPHIGYALRQIAKAEAKKVGK